MVPFRQDSATSFLRNGNVKFGKSYLLSFLPRSLARSVSRLDVRHVEMTREPCIIPAEFQWPTSNLCGKECNSTTSNEIQIKYVEILLLSVEKA